MKTIPHLARMACFIIILLITFCHDPATDHRFFRDPYPFREIIKLSRGKHMATTALYVCVQVQPLWLAQRSYLFSKVFCDHRLHFPLRPIPPHITHCHSPRSHVSLPLFPHAVYLSILCQASCRYQLYLLHWRARAVLHLCRIVILYLKQ
ncbi:hypothetical protein F4604DRAFT_57671 [Suillus subluteus]|nr:hypothetical protein F4604DRAFT_57671 [Suillus subluteus]